MRAMTARPLCLAAVLASLGGSGAAMAEEPPAFDLKRDGPKIIDHLKATPATLYDLSIVRLEARLASVGAREGFHANATYQDGRIQIYAYDLEHPVAVEGCARIFAAIRKDAGIDLETGYPLDPASAYASFFSYPRITEIDVSETYMETVDAILEIKVVLGVTGDEKGLVCDGPLLGKDFSHKAE